MHLHMRREYEASSGLAGREEEGRRRERGKKREEGRGRESREPAIKNRTDPAPT